MKRLICSMAWTFSAYTFVYAGTTVAATTIDTTSGPRNDIFQFGVPDTSTYGQTFTVGPDNIINSFEMYITKYSNMDASFSFKSYIYSWNGSGATGEALYTSSLQQYTGGIDVSYKFDTGNLALISGQKYVAFLSTAGLWEPGRGGYAAMPGTGVSTYAGGSFVYSNRGNSFSSLTVLPWTCNENCAGPYYGDAFFKASFSALSSAVPEPTTWGMMLAGFSGIGLTMRRRQRISLGLI